MALIDPTRSPVALVPVPDQLGFASYPDVQPFSQRTASGYQAQLEGVVAYLRKWYLYNLETGPQQVWDENVDKLIDAVNTVLTDAVHDVITGSIPVSSALYWAVLESQGIRHVEKYGAVGDLVADDRAACQAAIDAAATAYTLSGQVQQVVMDQRYLLGVTDYHNADGSVFGATCLTLKSGVHLVGKGLIKVKSGGYGGGAFFRIISSTSTGISNARVHGLTFDANLAGLPQSQQCNNINIIGGDTVEVSSTRHLSANGVAIAVGGNGDNAHLATRTSIHHNVILGCRDIGIQVSRFDGLIIADNHVTGANGNAIDVYGENGSGECIGKNFTITGNVIRSCSGVGIFPETVMQGVIADNVIDDCAQPGIWLNRINSMPRDVDIHDNVISNVPRGIQVLGDMQSIHIHDNTVRSASQTCVQLGDGGNVSGVVLEHNLLNGADGSVPRITVAGSQATNLHVRKNRSRFSDGFTDVRDLATSSIGNVYEHVAGVQAYHSDSIASGGTLSFVVPDGTAGKFTIYAESGGGSQSIWQGVYVCANGHLVFAGSLAGNLPPSNLIANVGTDGGRTAKITFTGTGSTVATRWTLERI